MPILLGFCFRRLRRVVLYSDFYSFTIHDIKKRRRGFTLRPTLRRVKISPGETFYLISIIFRDSMRFPVVKR